MQHKARRFCSWGALLCAALTAASALAAQAPSGTGALEKEVLAHASAKLAAQLGPNERSALEVSVTLVGGRGAARSPCPTGWKLGSLELTHLSRIVVPVTCGTESGSFIARLTVRAPVWLLKAARPAGHTLEEGDLVQELREVRSLSEIVPSGELLGLPLRRSLSAGTALRSQHVERPIVVRKGDAVEIVASQDGVSVSAPGVALGSGRLGDTIEVRNTRSQWIVRGRLIQPGIVEALSVAPPRSAGKATR